ncbi:MAG: triose-phosphate isomerase [Patescibacteria group bacterium]|jgi:triosephosphate isomerase
MSNKKPIVIANWKMKLGAAESVQLATAVKGSVSAEVETVVCPSFVSLVAVGNILKGSGIKLGAQDCFWEDKGAYTGEVSASQLKEIGCEFVILGHSERRKYLNETDDMVHQKVVMALKAGLTPIICVGETFQQRQDGAKDYVLIEQTAKALEGLEVEDKNQLIIAYEPVWVIGSGQAIEPQEAAAAHQVIRQSLFDLFPAVLVKNNFRVIYGGSVDQTNITDFIGLENTAGVLVGAASIKAAEFGSLIKNI